MPQTLLVALECLEQLGSIYELKELLFLIDFAEALLIENRI